MDAKTKERLKQAGINESEKQEFLDACRLGWIDDVQEYINQGGDVQVDDNMGLFNAINRGEYEIAKLLIKNGADINADDGFAIRDSVVWADDGDIFRFFLDNGADVHAKNDYPIKIAMQLNKLEIVNIIIFEYNTTFSKEFYDYLNTDDDEDSKDVILSQNEKEQLKQMLDKRELNTKLNSSLKHKHSIRHKI